MKKNIYIISILVLFISISISCNKNETDVNIKTNKEIGKIRSLNGGTLSPITNLFHLDMTDEFKALKIPIVRLHDCPLRDGNVVDIQLIFRNFSLDPTKGENYYFTKTDDYITNILKTGTKIIFRLGESIEHSKNKYFVHPPKDFDKWAEICCGIIRHYNEGWANGFHYNIKYWEIWNEPDLSDHTWTGMPEQFYKLYETAAKKIKKEFPDIMIGGPAIAVLFEKKDGKIVPRDFTKNFLTYCKENSIPLDFFSWHFYSKDPWSTARQPQLARNLLNQYGFDSTESHLNEWNYIPDNNWKVIGEKKYQGAERENIFTEQSGTKGAAFVTDVLMLLQDEPIDVANYYTTTTSKFGIYSLYGEPYKTYFALKAFAELLNTPIRIETDYNKADSLVICAGKNKNQTEINILASNFSLQDKKINVQLSDNVFDSKIEVEIYVIDKLHDLDLIKEYKINNNNSIEISEGISASTVLLIKLLNFSKQ